MLHAQPFRQGGTLGRVLVAGATGYLGRRIVSRLKTDGYWVRVLVRRPAQAAELSMADEVFIGEVTHPESLVGIAEGIDTVFSTIGITRQRDGVRYDDVDYRGNLSLLRQAERAGVKRFVYVSVLHGRELRDRVRLVAAKERFVDELAASSIASTVIRPTAYFSDMGAFLDMARKGTAFVIGDGEHRMNPISGEDLAAVCIQAVSSGENELEVGGPDVLSHNEIVRLAFTAAAATPRILRIPAWATRSIGWILGHITPERVYGPVQFFLAVMTADMTAPAHGTDRLAAYFAGKTRTEGIDAVALE